MSNFKHKALTDLLCRLQEPGPSGCPGLTRSAGSSWRPAGTGTLPKGRCSVLWSPACKASWSGSATVARSRKAAAWRTQTEKHSRQINTRVMGSRPGKCFVFMRNGEEKLKMKNVRAVLLVHSRWIYIIYEELIQTRKFANMCVLLFVRCVFVYKLYSLLAL